MRGWAMVLLAGVALAGCADPPRPEAVDATPTPDAQAAASQVGNRTETLGPLAPAVGVSYRYAFDGPVDGWGLGFHLASEAPLDCLVQHEFQAEALGNPLLFVQMYFVDGTESLATWMNVDDAAYVHVASLDTSRPPFPGLSFASSGQMRVAPEAGYRSLGMRLFTNRVSDVELAIDCQPPANLTVEVASDVRLLGKEDVDGAAGSSGVVSLARGPLPEAGLLDDGVAYGYSSGGSGTVEVSGPPAPTSWTLDDSGGFLIERRGKGTHSATVDRVGTLEGDQFWLLFASFAKQPA